MASSQPLVVLRVTYLFIYLLVYCVGCLSYGKHIVKSLFFPLVIPAFTFTIAPSTLVVESYTVRRQVPRAFHHSSVGDSSAFTYTTAPSTLEVKLHTLRRQVPRAFHHSSCGAYLFVAPRCGSMQLHAVHNALHTNAGGVIILRAPGSCTPYHNRPRGLV
jgi:hypothetical protein